MAGLNLGAGAQVRLGTPTSFGIVPTGTPASVSATEAAFGPGYTQTGTPSARSALTPNDPFGMAFWTGVGALVLLVFIRYSLPA